MGARGLLTWTESNYHQTLLMIYGKITKIKSITITAMYRWLLYTTALAYKYHL